MKTELRRIEAMLAQLAESHQEPMSARPQAIAPLSSVSALRLPSVGTSQASQPLSCFADPSPAPAVESTWSEAALKVSVPLSRQRSSGLSALRMPTLPKFAVADSLQHAAKPAAAVGVLKAIEGITLGWQDELHHCLSQIQALYAEGPIVDGWLEAYATGSHDGQSVHPEATAPSNATSALDRSGRAVASASELHPTAGLDTATGCRLCGLHDDGQLWFCHCPAEQLAAVSLAITRCERMKQLLTRKQHLETRLGKLAEALIAVYGHLTEA